MVCGRNGANMVKTILRLASERDELHFVDDQWGCPTFTDDLAGAIAQLAAARLPGLFHVTNQGPTTWFGFGPRRGGRRRWPSRNGAPHLHRRPFPAPTRSPARYSVLDNAALRASGLPLWRLPRTSGAHRRRR